MSLGMEVGLGPGDTVLNGDKAPLTERGRTFPPLFIPMSIVAKRSTTSATAELLFNVFNVFKIEHFTSVYGTHMHSAAYAMTLCLSVCLSVTSRRSIETAEWKETLLDTEATVGLSLLCML